MKIVLAPDSFKESMTAAEAVAAMETGVRAACEGTGMAVPEVVGVPMADGGEGFTEVIARALDAELRTVTVPDALGREVRASFAYDPAERLAVLESAQAVGLADVEPEDRDILASSSVGVGRLITAALDAGAERIVIGLGGSATNDAGAGMLTALGVRLLTHDSDGDGSDSDGDDNHGDGSDVEPVPARFGDITRIDVSGIDRRLSQVVVEIASDVTNPLLGERGASAVFGPQKGASPEQVEQLDRALAHFVDVAGHGGDGGPASAPGAGAAGGLGYALLAFCGATMRPGVEIVVELTGLEAAVRGADLVITGEGSIDAQTLSGKTPAGVAAVAARAGVPCLALAGQVGDGRSNDISELYGHGFTAILPIVPGAMGLREALTTGPANLAKATEAAVRLFLAGRAAPTASPYV